MLMIGLAAPAWADYQAGLDAYNWNEFAVALKEWQPLAEAGKARAEAVRSMASGTGSAMTGDAWKQLKEICSQPR